MSSSEVNDILCAIKQSCIELYQTVSNNNPFYLSSPVNSINSSSDTVLRVDLIANDIFHSILPQCPHIHGMISEEDKEATYFPANQNAEYFIAFDPIDGSKNIENNITTGSIFCIFKYPLESYVTYMSHRNLQGAPIESSENLTSGQIPLRIRKDSYPIYDNDKNNKNRNEIERKDPCEAIMSDDQPERVINSGRDIVCAGYCLFGTHCQLLVSTKDSTDLFSYNISTGLFELSIGKINLPNIIPFYCINQGYSYLWDEESQITAFIDLQMMRGKSLRFVGSMVADVHRAIIKGGNFLYPSNSKHPNGRLRLLYEVYPMSFIFENIGGVAITDDNKPILDVPFPENWHQRSSILLFNNEDYEEFMAL